MFTTVKVSEEWRYSVGVDDDTGKHYVAIPVSNGLVEYCEFYEIDNAAFERCLRDMSAGAEFAERCRKREMDHLLLVRPGERRGEPL